MAKKSLAQNEVVAVTQLQRAKISELIRNHHKMLLERLENVSPALNLQEAEAYVLPKPLLQKLTKARKAAALLDQVKEEVEEYVSSQIKTLNARRRYDVRDIIQVANAKKAKELGQVAYKLKIEDAAMKALAIVESARTSQELDKALSMVGLK